MEMPVDSDLLLLALLLLALLLLALLLLLLPQVAGLRSNLWPGAACACQGSRFTNIYVGWGIKNAPFVPLPPLPVSKEYDAALVESAELPLPAKEGEGEEGAEE
jgi:hypothetical protein